MTSRVLLVLVLLSLIGGYFFFDLGQYLSLEYIKSQQSQLNGLVDKQPITAGLIYFAIYIGVTSLSLPGAAIMTLAGGAIFGFGWGLVIVSFASTIGATRAWPWAAANIAKLEVPYSGTSAPRAMPLAVAKPTRNPVNEPGPSPMIMPRSSEALNSVLAIVSTSVWANDSEGSAPAGRSSSSTTPARQPTVQMDAITPEVSSPSNGPPAAAAIARRCR